MKKVLALIAVVSIALSMFLVLAVHTRAQTDTYVCPTILPPGSGLSSPGEPAASFDEQILMTFTQNLDSITYNVTANSQMDTYYYGPAYLVNGLSNTGYWYQVGLAYDWPSQNGGYTYGFNFAYEVFDTNGHSIFPLGQGGLMSFNGTVHNGDPVCLGLSFSNGNVTMSATDWLTNAYASQTYFGEDASYFTGLPSAPYNGNGYFSGPMTEWYHVNPYSGNEAQVTYVENSTALGKAWLFMEEWEPSNPNWGGAWQNYTLETLSQNQLTEYSFGVTGPSEWADATEFVSGAIALCAMKTSTDGYFYLPNPAYENPTSLRIEMLFTTSNATGDQTGSPNYNPSPYPLIPGYPDTKVDIKDQHLVAAAYGKSEGQAGWNYMADLTGPNGVPDRKVDVYDANLVARNYGNSIPSYSYDFNGVQFQFDVGGNKSPNAIGFVPIPSGATSFDITQNGISVGAMILFCQS